MVIAYHTVFGFRNSSVLCNFAIVEVFDRNVVVHQSAVVSDGICGSSSQMLVKSSDDLIRIIRAVPCI